MFSVSDKMIIFEKAGCGPNGAGEYGLCSGRPIFRNVRTEVRGRSRERRGGTGGASRRKFRGVRTRRKTGYGTLVIFLKRSVTVNGDAVASVRAEKRVVPAREKPGKTTRAAGPECDGNRRIPQGKCSSVRRSERQAGRCLAIPCGAGFVVGRCSVRRQSGDGRGGRFRRPGAKARFGFESL